MSPLISGMGLCARIRNKTRLSCPQLLLSTVIEYLTNANKGHKKHTVGIHIGKEEIKMSLLTKKKCNSLCAKHRNL